MTSNTSDVTSADAAPRGREVVEWIDRQPLLLGDAWLGALDHRKQEEAAFHDADRADHRDEERDSTSNRRFYAATARVKAHVDQWIARQARDAVFLDYACGNGKSAIQAAESDARLVVGIDISQTSVRNAHENAVRAGVADRTRFLQRDCEDTGLPSASFDAILCSGMLHHLDLNRAYPELRRLLRPGGRVLCVEALAYNPVIQLYRDRTPHLRTAWEKEHILGMRDLEQAKQLFQVENVRFFLLTAPLATLLPDGRLRRAGLALGHAIDEVLTRIPYLRLWSWQFSFELVRRD
jgi:SAM-dependent methyltransferase